jgi:adenine-specific DNA-methyltransferase
MCDALGFIPVKYMGSKRSMLENGLGQLIRAHSVHAKRVVDLFSGSGAVAWFAAENTKCPVLAIDLQRYSKVLAASVIQRTKTVNPETIGRRWLEKASLAVVSNETWFGAFELQYSDLAIALLGKKTRQFASRLQMPVMQAYGGHYFSPLQSLAFDALRCCLPSNEPAKSICLAALIAAASKCAAAPGHTAQPFTPSKSSDHSIREAWKKDPFVIAYHELKDICGRAAQRRGETKVGDAVKIAASLNRDDLVFVDPPYSGVQYSRFYHVLETLTIGKNITVSGVGRYPAREYRPQSAFSNKGQSVAAVTKLMEALAESGCTTLFTFPNGECSNGLSGDQIRELAESRFSVTSKIVPGKFSTSG